MNTSVRPLLVSVRRFIRAPRERVFDAWVNPEIRRRWWLNARGEGPIECSIDPRKGGRYTIRQIGGGDCTEALDDRYEWTMTGEFLEFDPPRRLVFTWKVNHVDEAPSDERVTVEFLELPDGTEIAIQHEGILSERLRAGTDRGWTTLLGIMADVLERR
jgi:uncharacterized protein YndB with AHSA1/START domain